MSPGPFRIQDVNSFGGGTLDVSIQEQDGSVTHYKVETSRLGTLTRPGQLIYQFVVGKPTKMNMILKVLHLVWGPYHGV